VYLQKRGGQDEAYRKFDDQFIAAARHVSSLGYYFLLRVGRGVELGRHPGLATIHEITGLTNAVAAGRRGGDGAETGVGDAGIGAGAGGTARRGGEHPAGGAGNRGGFHALEFQVELRRLGGAAGVAASGEGQRQAKDG